MILKDKKHNSWEDTDYNNFSKYIYDKEIENKKDFAKLCNLSAPTMAKLSKNEYVSMDVLVRTMVKAGIPLADAVRMASETPARIMGVDDRKGALQKDMDADVLILDRELNIRAAWAMGRLVEDTNTLF